MNGVNDTRPTERDETFRVQRKALYHTNWTGEESLATTIVRAVASVSNRETTELEPLYDTVDPEALETCVTSLCESSDCAVTFVYAGYEIRIDGDGLVTLCIANGDEPTA